MSKLLTAPLTIERGDIEIELEVTCRYIPYRRATQYDPPEGDEFEDIEAHVQRVMIDVDSAHFSLRPELALTDSELAQAEAALREAMRDD
jgi:hypothetical protein